MEADESQRAVPFQLQFDKPISSQIKIAEWNPEKDLLAMVTEDSKLLLHRFNWQRLWTTAPGKCITSICWRPDGKAIAVGLDDGTISLHDVEDGSSSNSTYEDRTARFFPPAPRVPRTPGLVPGDSSGFMDESDDSFRELFDSSYKQFDILCSGDKDGNICFNIFGIFPIGRVNIHNLAFRSSLMGNHVSCQLMDASICKVALSSDICHIMVLCSGVLTEIGSEASDNQMSGSDLQGLHCLVLDSTIFWKRKNELHQVAQQASNVEHLIEVIRKSLSVMSKQWSDAMHMYHDKFNALLSLIIDHGIDSSPQEELLSLLGGARTSPPVHQFLVNSLGEAGLKRVAKAVSGAGKELQTIVLDHLQPAAEIIGFRMGELRGLSKWRARYLGIGLDEKLIDNATEKAGMLLVQIERFIRVLSSVVQQFSNFFNWLLKCVKVLMSEPSDQLLPSVGLTNSCSSLFWQKLFTSLNSGDCFLVDSELVIIFLKFLYDQDPVGLLLQDSEFDHNVEVELNKGKGGARAWPRRGQGSLLLRSHQLVGGPSDAAAVTKALEQRRQCEQRPGQRRGGASGEAPEREQMHRG
ncbi:UNVERIFIED_CONTAM: Anaphase-promoting complex subunit [Sesamum radiatum]|uniref:Anaphase-promoting complex subunit 4 n=1 Tax=Sesamum radiatum TaxID=300843 RepID=A0AAW2K348_SESRA